MNQIKRVFERLDLINSEILDLKKELKKSEDLYHRADDPALREELGTNIKNINFKIKRLQSEDEHLKWFLGAFSKGGIAI